MERLHLVIKGDVQGVFFRAFVQGTAKKLELTGWVRNTDERTVEVIAEGTKGSLLEFVTTCKKGPPSSAVSNIEQEWDKATGEFSDFKIHH